MKKRSSRGTLMRYVKWRPHSCSSCSVVACFSNLCNCRTANSSHSPSFAIDSTSRFWLYNALGTNRGRQNPILLFNLVLGPVFIRWRYVCITMECPVNCIVKLFSSLLAIGGLTLERLAGIMIAHWSKWSIKNHARRQAIFTFSHR